MRSRTPLTVAALAISLIAGAHIPSATGQEAPEGPASAPMPGPGGAQATLHPGDAVRVYIWREPDLSGDFAVDAEGRIALPLVGELTVSGMPARAVRDTLLTLYREHVINPTITIVPLRRVHILGEVHRPGLYGLDPTITLAGAVAMAGGATPTGDIRRIQLIRENSMEPLRVSALDRLENVDIRSGDHIIVQQRSWFERNSTFLVSAMLSVTGIVVSLLN
jgi:protein involved in polysaccharide export with SLBB domain